MLPPPCIVLIYSLIAFATGFLLGKSGPATIDPDLNRNTAEIIVSRGYVVEEHYVETTDGFVLGLHVCSWIANH